MKKKIELTLAILLISVININAQVDKEIRDFADSTEIIVRSGKHMLTESLKAKDYDKAKEIASYLHSLKKAKNYQAFSYSEDIYLSLLLYDWNYLDYLTKNYKTAINETCIQSDYNILNFLQQDIMAEDSTLDTAVKSAGLDPGFKDMLNLLTYALTTKKINWEWNNELNTYKKMYPNSEYKDFIENFLPGPYKRNAVSYAVGAGFPSFTSNLGKIYKNTSSFSISLDIITDKIYSSMYLQNSDAKINGTLTAYTNSGTINFYKDDKFKLCDYGLYLGYFLTHNDKIQFAPYINVGRGYLISDIYKNPNDNDKEVTVYNSFTPGIGLHSEFRIGDIKELRKMEEERLIGYISFRLDGGINFITNTPTGMDGNLTYLKASLVLGIGDF